MSVTTEQVKELRQLTGAGVLDCRKALDEAGGDVEQAQLLLREKGLVRAAGRADRVASDGVIELYNHGDGRVGVMVEVNSETDFVARTPEFRAFAHELALQIAANSPKWVTADEVPAEALEQERSAATGQAEREGKPESVIERIAEGKVEKFLDENVLMRQPYVRDEDKTIEELVNEMVLSTGENISIRRFQRWELGEALD